MDKMAGAGKMTDAALSIYRSRHSMPRICPVVSSSHSSGKGGHSSGKGGKAISHNHSLCCFPAFSGKVR